MNTLLIVFAKNPVPGKAKTRLSKDIGEEAAMKVYTHLLNHTSKEAQGVESDRWIAYADFINPSDMWPEESFTKMMQSEGDLGQRMETIFSKAFEEDYERIIIIGTDCYDLKSADLKNGFDLLCERDAVIGPANDGGYYLLGLSKPCPRAFRNISWSSELVLEETLNVFKEEGLSFTVLHEKTDIDLESDLPDHLKSKFIKPHE